MLCVCLDIRCSYSHSLQPDLRNHCVLDALMYVCYDYFASLVNCLNSHIIYSYILLSYFQMQLKVPFGCSQF